jgi:hypothetical protein
MGWWREVRIATGMAGRITPSNLTACPVCGKRMELLWQHGGLVSAGCKPCHFSLSVPLETWQAAKAERDASYQPPPPSPAPRSE